MFKVVLTEDAEADLRRFAGADRALYHRITRTLKRLESEYERGKPLAGPLNGWRSFRVGEFRVIYEVLHEEKAALVVRIEHRKDVYRP